MAQIAELHDCIPLVTTAAAKAALSPTLDQVIYYDPSPNPLYKRARGRFERWSGSAWVPDSQYLNIMVAVYSASVNIDAEAGIVYQLTVTDGSAFTIEAPGNPQTGFVISYDILNSSGGSMGTITWDSVFKLAGSFTNPANTKRRTITFYYNGTNWIELWRAEADI